MLYNQPYDQPASPNAPYVDGNPSSGTPGSIPRAAAIEYPQREIINLLADAGLTPTNNDLHQIAKAVQTCALNYAVDSGAANAYVATLVPAPGALNPGFALRVKITNTNTGASTLNVNGLGAKPIVTLNGGYIPPGGLAAGMIATFVYDGTTNFQMASLARLPSSTTLYVRTDGNDANDGSVNNSSHAFATIQAALNYAQTLLALGNKALTIQLGVAGTYAAPSSIPASLGAISIVGNTSAISSYVIAGAGTSGASVIGVSYANVTLSGLTLSNTGNIAHTLAASLGGSVALDHVNFSQTTGLNTYAHIAAFGGGSVQIGAGCNMAYTMGYVLAAYNGGSITMLANIDMTPGNGSFTAFAFCQGGYISTGSGLSFTGVVSISGYRYIVALNGVINTFESGANFFPGATPGSASSGGQYA